MATHTNANTFSTKLHRNVLTMPKWVTETHDRVGPKPPPPPSPTTPDSGVKLPVLPPKSKNLPEPDYEVIEFSGQQYSNEVLKAGSRSKTPSTPDAKLKCTLCGSHNPWVTCEECAQQIFCASCDDMFHKHPKRRAHVRKAVEQTRPPLPPKILPGQNGPTPPVAPPRRKGRGFATPLLQRKEQVDMNTLPIPPSPTPSLRSTSWQDRVSSLKSGLNLMNRPLPDTPKTPTSEHTSSRSVTPKSVFDSIQRPPSVTLEKIKSKASATLDRMTLLQQRYRQHKADSQRSNNDCSGSVTDQNLSFDQWSNISPSPSHFRSGSMSSGINSSHFDLTDDTHFHNMFNQRQMHPSTAQQQRANGQLGTRGMSTSVFNLSHINRRAPEPQNTWMNNPMQQAQSMAHLNCATCASPQTNAWHAHTQRHMPMANVQTDGWGNQFPSQQQLNRSNLSLNVGAGYMMPHHHGASGMMAPPPVFMNQTGMMTGMYPYPYHGGMPVMNPGIMGMPPPTRSRATSRAGSRAASPAMSRKSMPVRRKQRTTSYVEDELTDDEDSDQDDRRSIISNRSGMTNTLRARQRRISSASQLLDDESETNQRQTRGKLRDARDRRGSIAKSVQSDWLPSRRPTVNHSSSSNRQNEPGFVNTNKPTRIYSDLDSESSGTRALVQAKIQEKLEKSTKRSSSKEKIAEAARQKPNKVSTEVQAGGSRTIAKSASATAVKAEENQAPVKQNTGKYESVQIKANKKEASEDDEEEEEEEEVEESGSEETESEQEEEEQVAEVSTQLEEGNASQAVDASEANEDDLGPPPSTPDHEWECEFCTYVNEPNVKICLICCKTPSHGARKTSTTTAPTPSVSEEQPTKVSAATSLSPERASVDKEKRTSSTERTKDKPKDKVKEKPKDKVTSTSTSTSTGTTAIPKRKTGVAQSIISNLTNGMSKLKITSSEHNSGATTLTKKKESVEEVWAALDDNIQATANEIMRKAEKSKKSTKVSTSCGTSPIREVPKAKDAQKLQRSVKETGTSPPPQSISTQTYDTLPLRQPEPSVAETVATGGGGIFYSENSQLHRDAHSPLSILPPDMPHYEPRHKEPETELYILLKEAELYKFTPEELHAALKYCGTSTHPIQWLRENWHKLIQTVQSLSTKYGQERAENIIGTISQIEAREALRQHGGNIWQAVSECIEQRQRKYRDISSKGNFSREDIVTALTIHQGNADLALLDLGRTQLKPFLMRIRGSPAGVENESGAIFPPASPIEHTIQPEIHDFLSANASECLQTPNAAGAAFITDHPSPLHEQSTNEYRNPMFDGIYRYSPYSREASSSSFHLDDPAFNNRNMLKDLETLIGNIEQNQAKENEPMLKTMETMLGDSLGKREVEHENDPEMMRILMKSPIATQYAKRTLSNANSRSQSQLDVKNFVWQHIQEIVPNLVQQVEMELMADDAQEANTAGEIMIDQKLQPPEPPPIDAEEFILEEVIGPNIKEASIRELVPPEFVYAAEIANFRMEFDRALDREHEEEFDFDSCDEAERTIYKMYTAPEEEKLSAEKEDAAEFSIPEIEGENLTEDSKVKSENEREDLAEELSDTQAMGASAAHKSQITSETEETERHDEQENEQLTEQVTNGTVVNDGNNKIEIPNEQNEEARKSAEKVTDNSPEISIANANEQRKVPQTEESNAFNEEQPSRSNRASQETLVNVAAALSNESNEATTSTTVVPQVLEEADTPAAVSFTDTSKLKRNEKMQRRQRKSQLPKNVNGPELKVGGDMRRTDAKDRHITKSSNKQQEATPPNDENLQQKAENEDAASSEDLLAEHALDAKTPHEASSTDNTKPNQEAPNLKDRQPRVSRIPVRRSGSRISESEAMEIEVENQTPELPVETVLSNDKRAEIKLKTSGNESQIDAAMRNEQVQEESSERQSSDHQEVYQHADTQAMATQSNVEPTVVEKTIDTKSQNSLSRTENEHASSAAEPKTAVSSKGGAVSKIPQIRTDASEASTSNSLRSTMSITRNNKVGLQKSAIPSAKSMAEQAKPKESKIPKQTPKKVPLRSKSFSGPPGPIGISSVKAIQQEFLKRQNQLTTRYEPPKNPPTIVRKESIVEAITKYMPSTSASASGSKTIAAASIFRTHARIPKKKYHETCFSDDDYETTASEEEPEPLEIRQRKQSVPVFRAYPSVQELEVVPTEVLVRKFVDEKLVASVAEAQIAATLVNMRFQQDVSIWAAKECSDLDQAISMLQQDCELCMGIYPMNQIVSMLKCTHKCCKQCAKTYFTVQITDRSINDCTCPFCKLPELHGHNEHEDENLEYFSNLDIFLKNILDAEVHELFQRKLRDRTLLQDPNFKWCIQCSSGFFARPKQKRLICPDCGSVTCAQCRKAWEKQHEGISCEQFKEWKEANDPEVQAQGVQEHLAQNGIDCPKCKFRYSLARGGCMHFTCTQCKYEFCYGCGKPFMMGAKCTISSYCAKLGLHAHHPRNCLFYLRDKLPIQLQMLLKQNNIPYDEDPIELPNADAEDASTSTPKSARCPIALQKETPTGLVDTVCNGEVPDKHAGLCRTHYVEYLTAKVAKARIDPLPIFDLTDCVQELRRRDIRLPERGPWDTDEIYKGMCSEVIKNNIPLETM
ncbi:E3 ubiquitin-protein ligase lubel isoform X4 [Anastrepha ludens]|uniref:E3 ubiquitin-protein ligase lubel isoform X4 n=1 Tax=Anastrepha ludens TaxID=28586 RepID=UPI0023B0AB72|nr:E3 ubiquitin-protein ligase lubel isoform X4 [Anastrepha ludens]